MSTSINMEPEEDEEVEQIDEPEIDEPNDDEDENEENSPDDEEEIEPPPKPRRKKRRRSNTWIYCIAAILIAAVIAVGVYFGVFYNPCYDRQSYSFVKDVETTDPTAPDKWRLSLFSGLVTHNRMLSICKRTHIRFNRQVNGTTGQIRSAYSKSNGAIYINNVNDETKLDKNIRDQDKNIFGSAKKLMWTGVTFKHDKTNWVGIYQKDPNEYGFERFCNKNKTKWNDDLDKKSKNETVYVVKNYEKTGNACWELYTAKELVEVMNQPVGSIPRLHFSCASPNTKDTSGEQGIPGKFYPKIHKKVDGKEYWIYAVPATIEDARKECEVQKQQLVFIDSQDKGINPLKKALDEAWKEFSELKFPKTTETTDRDYLKIFRAVGDRVWTGGYLDVLSKEKVFQWHAENPQGNETKTRWDNKDYQALFKVGFSLDGAIGKLKSSITEYEKGRQKGKDCNVRTDLYVGLENDFENKDPKLIILNPDGELDPDSVTAHVVCEPFTGKKYNDRR